MSEDDFYYRYTLRRRRLLGCIVLVPVVLTILALNGWRLNPFWTWFGTDEGVFFAGDPFGEWIYTACDGARQHLTVHQDGRLAGVEGLESLRTVRFRSRCDLPLADNPDLPAWRAGLSRLQTLTAAPAASARAILDAAREMPVSVLYLKEVSDWIRADRSNAVDFLDALAARPMTFDHPDRAIAEARRSYFAQLVGAALEGARTDSVPREKLAAWIGTQQIVEGARVEGARGIEGLASLGQLDNDARVVLLQQLEDAPTSQRAELYSSLAPHLVAEARHATLLVEQLRHVPPAGRTVAMRQLLTDPDVSREFLIALLFDSGRLFHAADVRLDLFTVVADALQDEDEAPLLLTRHLRSIPGIQRRLAATHLLRLDDSGQSDFALAVLRSTADLHPLSRPKLLYSVMQSEQFRDPRVQEACLLAIRLDVGGPEQRALLGTMLGHRELDEDLHARIVAELGPSLARR